MAESTLISIENVFTHLRETTHCLRRGALEAAQTHIASATLLLEGFTSDGRNLVQAPPKTGGPQSPGALMGWRARRVAEYIEANLFSSIRIDHLAAIVGLSNSHFCRTFRCRFGVSPHFYINRRRIEFSRHLMLTTRAPLSEIALTCGMSDQAHFTKVFKRIVGEAPHRWRHSQLSGELRGAER